MVTDSADGEYSCENCEETFEHREELEEHMKAVHDADPEAEPGEDDGNEDTAAADTDAAGSTGSITEETNDTPSAAEPAEAAGPSGDDVRPDEDEIEDES